MRVMFFALMITFAVDDTGKPADQFRQFHGRGFGVGGVAFGVRREGIERWRSWSSKAECVSEGNARAIHQVGQDFALALGGNHDLFGCADGVRIHSV